YRPTDAWSGRAYARNEDAGAAPGARKVRLRCGFRRRTARRGKVAGEGAHLLVPQCCARMGSEEPASGNVEDLQYSCGAGGIDPRVSAVQLDRARYLAVYPARKHSHSGALSGGEAACRAAWRAMDHGR